MKTVPVIAIFDVGKTNKKFFLIDEHYNILLETSTAFPEIKDEDDELCDDIMLLSKWVLDTLTENVLSEKFDIRAVNFSAYGASLVYIDEEGKVIAPLYNYLKKYPEKIQKEFYETYGNRDKVSLETASPALGSLNSGMQLYRIKKERPLLFEKIKYALHLPQYLSFLITNKAVSDITSIGSHTRLWDFRKNDYHIWVREEGLDEKLAPIVSSDKAADIVFDGKRLKAGPGIHDSSAALIPYLAVFKEPFVLISTGTWCISLNPFNDQPLTSEELEKDCLSYFGYNGKPVKASRLFAGQFHEAQTKRLSEYFGKPLEFYKEIKFNADILAQLFDAEILKEGSLIEEEGILESSIFERRDLEVFKNYEEAYHCLLYDTIQQQFFSTQLVIHGSSVTRIFVDGGFSNNAVYMNLLADAFSSLEVYAASVAQATAVGAALAIHEVWNSRPIPSDMVKLTYYGASRQSH